ncbi:TIR domain-containing protein [Taibaiella chishuiensis]|uniref:TIR domain-containing protein n=2 Tax=Taibaiella chishuiensis TaxID=1434707 RepID=A0A2P8D8F4_9BACT|nr:TIR domain-containing protein [Taibaiella chishuiensis]
MVVINCNLFKKYDVALSFAEEDRAFVDIVARLLKERDVRIFYDDDKRVMTWGRDLRHDLDKVYRLQARLCVVFVSEAYGRKYWTSFEMFRIRARALFQRRRVYFLPYLMDESEYARALMDIGCLTRKNRDEHGLADAIVEKLNQQPVRRFVLLFLAWFAHRLRRNTTIALLAGGGLFLFRDTLTPVDILTQRIYERNTRRVEGSVCGDGAFSERQGRGSCSHHGGVARKVDTVLHDKTMEDCRREARSISIW